MEIVRHPRIFGAGLMTNFVLNRSKYKLNKIIDVWKSQGSQE